MSTRDPRRILKREAHSQADAPVSLVTHGATRPTHVARVLHLQRAAGNQAVNQLLNRHQPLAADGVCPVCGRRGKGHCPGCGQLFAPIQAKLTENQPGDQSEQEADRVAGEAVRALERDPHHAPNSMNTGGNQLSPSLNAFFESRFGHDLQQVHLHTGDQAATAARTVNARAFTVGQDIVFGAGQYAPNTTAGLELLAHELTHVMQQTGGGSRAQLSSQAQPSGVLQCSPDEKRAESSSTPHATDFSSIRMHFDGRDLIVTGDRRELFRFSSQSGRPVRISEQDASQCGANPVIDSYMNDARFVGVTDFGPIPEGTYTFSPPAIERFTGGEQFELVMAGIFGSSKTTIKGHEIHSGDWGGGRVSLSPRGRLREGPCGNANKRSGFYLHGGIMAGSSGCIDIGGDFDTLVDFLTGYRRSVTLTVAYEHPPPSVGVFTGLSGAIAYGRFGLGHGPSLRLGAEFAPTGTRALASIGYNAILQWAGGAATAGARLDVPLTDRETFIRAGLSGGVNFRILRALHGRLFGGYSWELTGSERRSGLELGGGLQYDFGRVQLEALYNILRPMSEDERVHQALLGIGFTF